MSSAVLSSPEREQHAQPVARSVARSAGKGFADERYRAQVARLVDVLADERDDVFHMNWELTAVAAAPQRRGGYT